MAPRVYSSPIFSPDGRRILAEDQLGPDQLVSLDRNGAHPRVLARSRGPLAGFDWGP